MSPPPLAILWAIEQPINDPVVRLLDLWFDDTVAEGPRDLKVAAYAALEAAGEASQALVVKKLEPVE